MKVITYFVGWRYTYNTFTAPGERMKEEDETGEGKLRKENMERRYEGMNWRNCYSLIARTFLHPNTLLPEVVNELHNKPNPTPTAPGGVILLNPMVPLHKCPWTDGHELLSVDEET